MSQKYRIAFNILQGIMELVSLFDQLFDVRKLTEQHKQIIFPQNSIRLSDTCSFLISTILTRDSRQHYNFVSVCQVSLSQGHTHIFVRHLGLYNTISV